MISIRHFVAIMLWGSEVCVGSEPKPDFALLRADEDYSSFSAATLSGWSRLKFLPLSSDRTLWLSLGGEICARYEQYRNEGWSDALNDRDGYLLTRAYVHADLHADSVRFFGQLQSSLSEGRRGGPGPIDEDRLDVQQAFVSWTSSPPRNGETVEFRLGRQEIQYGSGRIISVRAGANTRRTFEGGLVRLKAPDNRVDLFWFSPVETRSALFDDRRLSGTYLHGIYATLGKLTNGMNLDTYLLDSRESSRGYVGIAGPERRWSVGVRPWGQLGLWDYNLEFVGQFGRLADESIRAWTAASDVGFTWKSGGWHPRLGLKANIASGDARPGDGRLGTFSAIYQKAGYFGDISQVGPANFENLHPSLTIEPAKTLTLTFDAVFYWRQRLQDGLYGPSLRLEREPRGSKARHIGNQFDGLLSWQLTAFFTVDAGAAVFTAGRFLQETGPSRTVRYAHTSLTYMF